MRNALLLLLIAASVGALAMPGSAEAQVRPWQISIVGGPSLPIGDFADHANTGYHVQGSVGFEMPQLPFGVRADLLWQEVPEIHEGWFRQIGGLVSGVIGTQMAAVQPYALLGVGFVRTEAPEHEGGGSESHFGLNAGVGVNFPFVGLTGVLEARLLNVAGGGDATDHRTVPISIGIKF